MSETLRVDDDGLHDARALPRPATMVGAIACAGLAILAAAATVWVTFALSASYGFGPVWDLSGFVMTIVAAMIAGGAAVAALRLARLRTRSLPVLTAAVAVVLVAGYAAGAIGNRLH